MTDDSIVYTINLIIGAILSAVMGRQRHLESSGRTLPAWIVAAWTLTAADLMFVLRAEWPLVVPRMLPTLMVTAGHVMLLLAAHRSAARPPVMWALWSVIALHVALQTGFVLYPDAVGWRTVTNGIIWGVLSVAAALVLRHAASPMREAMRLPALVLMLQGAFHAVRTLLAATAAVQDTAVTGSLVQTLGNFEVSLFMVALFVSVLVAFLQLGNRELRDALDNVQQLSGMLPLCAWCHKVRDDDGYWQRLEEYLAEHRINVTHGMCESCAADHLGRDPGGDERRSTATPR
jgi:uncharacterized membrane protein